MKLGWMTKEMDWMKIERILSDRKVKKLAWMEKERQSDWKWKKIESNLKRG